MADFCVSRRWLAPSSTGLAISLHLKETLYSVLSALCVMAGITDTMSETTDIFEEGPVREIYDLVLDLDGFEGPIDLLLTLARKQKGDLTKISILTLAEQYLSFITAAKQLRLEIAAYYLVMAAWLAYLKSRLL